MSEWLKTYIGGLIADIALLRQMLEQAQAEIAQLKTRLEKPPVLPGSANDGAGDG